MNCRYCNKPIVLVPSAQERAAKDVAGRPASYFSNLFTYHADCQLKLRAEATSELLRRTKGWT